MHYTELQIRQGKKAEIQFPLSGDLIFIFN
jgi:hypothetical protein